MAVSEHLAVVFDFDDTLVPDSTSMFLESKGYDTETFWRNQVDPMVRQGFDAPLAYLQLMLDEVGPDGGLGALTNDELRLYGATLDDNFFPGLPELFVDLKEMVSAEYRDLVLEFYIVSSGIQSIIEGSTVVNDHFSGVYACRFGEGPEGYLQYIKRCVTFTEKTRYLFEINKGIPPEASETNPGLVNKRVEERRVPLSNMVYVGDGLTDIPCFSLVNKGGGTTFGVFEPTSPRKAKQALQEFLKAGRTVSSHAPRYSADDELGSFIRAAVATTCSQIELRREQARSW